MTYWLCSRGKLLDGADEKLALQAIHRIAKLPEDKARAIFLSGKPIRIKQVDSRETLEKTVVFLRKAGVDVFIHQQSGEAETSSKSIAKRGAAKERKPAPSAVVASEEKNKNNSPTTEVVTTKKSPHSKYLLAITTVIIALLAGMSGYGWYRLYTSESELVAHAGNTLADGKMATEVHGLNAGGQPLSGSWPSNVEGKGRVTKTLKGEVKPVDVYIADDFIHKEKIFDITDILAQTSITKETKSRPFEIMPEKIDIALWNNYAKLDFNGITFSEKDWWGMTSRIPVSAGITFSAAKGYIFHAPDSWNTSPKLGLYFPVLTELHAVLSAVSTTIEIPPPEYNQPIYHRVNYPYQSDTQKLSVKREHKGMEISTQTLALGAKIEKGEKLTRVKGNVVIRIPEQVTRVRFPMNDLWTGVEIKGVKVSFQEVSPEYSLKIEGALDRLVNLYGVPKEGGRIAGYPINFQSGGYWTITLPMDKGIEQVELIVADKQKIVKMPFDIKPKYTE